MSFLDNLQLGFETAVTALDAALANMETQLA